MNLLINSQRDQYFNEKSQLFKLLSSPVKLKLLQFISFAPRTVEDCANKMKQSIQNTSLHLISLEKAGILEKWKVKNFHFYSLVTEGPGEIVNSALELGGQSLIKEDLIYQKDMAAIAQEIKTKKVTLIDLRSFEETSFIPLPTTVHFEGEIKDLPDFMHELPATKNYLLLCKGKLCERLSAAIKLLAGTHKVRVLPYSAKEVKELASYL